MEPFTTISELIQLCRVLTPVFRKAHDLFQQRGRLPQGVVDRNELSTRKRLAGEVFASELLKEPVRIEPNGDRLRIVVDRRNVKQAVITTAGKRELCESFVAPEAQGLIRLDRSIHTYLRDFLSHKSHATTPLVLPPLPFRWASGGILPLVGIDSEYCVPMFFRDIEPAGWNIPLGSSERLIDHDGRVLSDFDDELNSPSLFMLREFLEETLVLDRPPSSCRPKRFRFSMPFALPGAPAHIAEHLQDQHRDLRMKYDHIEIMDDDDLVLNPSYISLPMDLRILSNKPNPKEVANVLVAISCLDLGIEIVNVIEYDIPKGITPYFLDGEILADKPSCPELARMPVALFPLKLLRELFEGDISLQYRGTVQASLEIPRPLTKSDIAPFPWDIERHNARLNGDEKSDIALFPWDIERRNAIIDGDEMGIGQEVMRYKRWKANYGDFSDRHVPSLFTPATFKVLNMLFSGNIVRER